MRAISRSAGHGRTLKRRTIAGATVALLLAGALVPSLARADGDPASDVLLSQPAFVPADAGFSTQQQASLDTLLRVSARAGVPVRVAVIPEAYDLGYVSQLWGKPGTYAQFLGVELSLVFKGPLLVVMPHGFGFNWAGHSTSAYYAALSRVAIQPGGVGLLDATQAAVRELAGVTGAKPPASGSSAGAVASSAGPPAIYFVAVGALAAALVLALAIRRGRRSRPGTTRAPSPVSAGPSPASQAAEPRGAQRPLPVWLRFGVPGFALAFGALVGVPMLAFSGARSSPTASAPTSGSGPAETPPVTWPEGSRAAPDFSLTDQRGHRVSIAGYRGRPVIVTFIDPLCRRLCPLAGQVLSRAERQLPASKRPEIIAVSANIYADSRANLLKDFSKWNLTSQWQWAVGDPRQLASVWRRYYAEVNVTTKHIAGTTVHYVTHSEMAYVIDRDGYERALLTWPYSAKQVERTVESL